MKKIEAIIRKTKFEDVKEALLQSDIDWFEYHNVHGIGQSREERIYRGVQYSTDVIERVALTIVCRDQFVDPTVKVILEVAHTGDVGDGRIFVSDMIDTWSIRTGEHGDTVLRDKLDYHSILYGCYWQPCWFSGCSRALRCVKQVLRVVKTRPTS